MLYRWKEHLQLDHFKHSISIFRVTALLTDSLQILSNMEVTKLKFVSTELGKIRFIIL